MLKELAHTVRLTRPVDDSLHQAFTDILNGVQTAMNRIALDHQQLTEKVLMFQDENRVLRDENTRLREEAQLARLPQHAQPPASLGHAGLVAPAPAPAPPSPSVQATQHRGAQERFTLVRSISIHMAPVHSVVMLNKESSNIVATASWDSTVKLYDLENAQVTKTFGDVPPNDEGKMGGLYAVAFAKTAPDIFGCASCDRSVYLWNHATGQLLMKLQGHQDEVNGIDFHSTQQVMCTASDDCKAMIWDFQEGMTLRTLDKHTKAVYGCTFLGQENQYLVATCCFDQKTRIFDMRDKQVVGLLTQHTDDVIGINYNSTKNILATGSDDGLILLWDTRTFKNITRIDTKVDAGIPDNEVKRISFTPDGNMLAAACSSGRVLVYDIAGSRASQIASLAGHTDCVFDVAWGRCPQTNSRILVSASHDHSSRYWRENS